LSLFDPDILAERVARLQRHLDRVAARLPPTPDDLEPATDASDAVVLHLWQAVQLVIDLGIAACVKSGLGTPPTYADAFRRLAEHGHIDRELAERLTRACGLRNVIAHAYDSIDLRRVHEAAQRGPADLLAFVRQLRDL